jgi:hypothetical protein
LATLPFTAAARDLGETLLMFLMHPTITQEQMGVWAVVVRLVVK